MVSLIDTDLVALQEMRTAVKSAKAAQQVYMKFSQDQVDQVVKAVANAAFAESERLGKLAVEETGMGVAEHKKIKNEVGSRDVYESIKDLKTVGIVGEDKANKVMEIAVPFGIVAGIIPTTNPTSTAFFKTLIALKTRNAIVVSPHPYAVRCTQEALRVCEEAAVTAGAPRGLIQCLTMASMEATQQLMKHPDINLILATGGGALVKAAYSSGKPAYGVGPGNVPVYIERTAKIETAVENIVNSKSFDYGTICATEQSIVVDRNVAELVTRALKKNGAYILSDEEKQVMEKVISPVPGKVNPKIVGKSPQTIAKLAGISLPTDTRIIVGLETKVGKEVPFSLEKLSPIFAMYIASDIDHAKEICLSLLELGGMGHSLSIHTETDAVAREFALEMPVSRILVNTMSSVGAVGGTTGLMPSMTLGCGTFGGNITSDNVTAKHLLNIKRMAYGIKEVNLTTSKIMPSKTNNSSGDVTDQVVESVLQSLGSSDKVNPQVVKDLVSEIVNKLSK
ncbi:aldehyde dehydrogenase family protein [Psychrobacillus sp. INOP01]|uniref:aldehyde dehydrogenase family protein n=1 Tax=Psychrobacillus sp. INOP01 TaxID=2829187 RepID=UPI001BAB15ED|nr:aldehyde dehydrogenase family protein [Psychrobacillus sp. INOP01]QUG43560.1 aldehyde dehydrogenase family protein [Psychrobacillus sp. INOP01]